MFTSQPEPWHIQENNIYRTPTKYEKTLKNIHRLEHELGMNKEVRLGCNECMYFYHRHEYWGGRSMYDPDIEGEIKK